MHRFWTTSKPRKINVPRVRHGPEPTEETMNKKPLPMTYDKDHSLRTYRAEIDQLMGTQAYQQQRHVDHAATVKRVNDLYGLMAPGTEDE